MRARLIGCGLLLALTIASRAGAADPPYYLALGDSLASAFSQTREAITRRRTRDTPTISTRSFTRTVPR
jgi:hypothetical protein